MESESPAPHPAKLNFPTVFDAESFSILRDLLVEVHEFFKNIKNTSSLFKQ
jgi:hypothetical protein